MKIGIAGPISLDLLTFADGPPADLPTSYQAPTISAIVNGLLARGHEVVVFTTAQKTDQPYVYESPPLVVCAGRGRPAQRARDLFRQERKDLLDLSHCFPVDVMNAHWSYEFAWAALDSGRPTIVTLRDNARTVLMHSRDAYRLARLLMSEIVLSRARHLSANSEYLFETLSPRRRQRARIIAGFYSASIDALAQEASAMRSPPELPVVAVVSNGFGRLKNVATALEAFALVRRALPDAELRLVGDGLEPNGPAHVHASRRGLDRGAHFCGRKSYQQTLREIASATVLLHPSLEESFGMSVLEAMVLGTPVVGGYDSGNVPFLLDGGRAGLLCDVRSPERIADTVVRLLERPEDTVVMCDRAREFARTRFGEQTAISAYVEYYRDVLELGR